MHVSQKWEPPPRENQFTGLIFNLSPMGLKTCVKTDARSKHIPLIDNGGPWRRAAWSVLKWCTIGGLLLGFLAGSLSLLGGNTISVNGMVIVGWYGVWALTLALGIAGFLFGLIWALVFKAIALAARR